MARLHMAFDPPFPRNAVVGALKPMVGQDLPAEVSVKLSVVSRDDDIDDTPDATADPIAGIEINGFDSLTEVATFLNALPQAVNDRLKRMNYTATN